MEVSASIRWRLEGGIESEVCLKIMLLILYKDVRCRLQQQGWPQSARSSNTISLLFVRQINGLPSPSGRAPTETICSKSIDPEVTHELPLLSWLLFSDSVALHQLLNCESLIVYYSAGSNSDGRVPRAVESCEMRCQRTLILGFWTAC